MAVETDLVREMQKLKLEPAAQNNEDRQAESTALVNATARAMDSVVMMAQNFMRNPRPPPEFNGTGNVTEFLEHLENYFQLNAVPLQQKVLIAAQSLVGRARTWYATIGKEAVELIPAQEDKFQGFKDSIERAFPQGTDRVKWEAELYGRRQVHLNEHLPSFVSRKIELFRKLYGQGRETELLQLIMSRFRPEVQDYVELRNPGSMQQLYEMIVKYQARAEERRSLEQVATRQTGYRPWYGERAQQPNFHQRRNVVEPQREYPQNRRESQRTSHEERRWNVPRYQQQYPGTRQQRADVSSPPVQINMVKLQNVELPYLVVKIQEVPVKALVDTGSAKTFISEHLFNLHFRQRILQKVSEIKVISAQGHECKVIGGFQTTIRIQDEQTEIFICVIRNLNFQAVLGLDFLRGTNAKLDFQKDTLELKLQPVTEAAREKLEIDWTESSLNEQERGKLVQLNSSSPSLFSSVPDLTPEEYEVKIEQKPGKQNLVADALSRAPNTNIDKEEEIGCALLASVVLDSREGVIDEIKTDEELSGICQDLEDPEAFDDINNQIVVNPEKYSEKLKEAQGQAHKARVLQETYYNRHRREPDLKVGDRVLKLTHWLSSAPKQIVAKFCPKFDGPYKIERLTETNAYIRAEGGDQLVVNVDQIKKYYLRSEMPLLQNNESTSESFRSQLAPTVLGDETGERKLSDKESTREVPTRPRQQPEGRGKRPFSNGKESVRKKLREKPSLRTEPHPTAVSTIPKRGKYGQWTMRPQQPVTPYRPYNLRKRKKEPPDDDRPTQRFRTSAMEWRKTKGTKGYGRSWSQFLDRRMHSESPETFY